MEFPGRFYKLYYEFRRHKFAAVVYSKSQELATEKLCSRLPALADLGDNCQIFTLQQSAGIYKEGIESSLVPDDMAEFMADWQQYLSTLSPAEKAELPGNILRQVSCIAGTLKDRTSISRNIIEPELEIPLVQRHG